MIFRFGSFFVFVFALCLLTSGLLSSANAQDQTRCTRDSSGALRCGGTDTTTDDASNSSGSDTCNPEIQERMEQTAAHELEHSQRVVTGIFQPIEPAAELVCLDSQIASASNTIGSIFSDNPDFFNTIKNTITLPTSISNSVLSTLASVLGGNPFSSGGIGDLLGGVLGFTMPSQCDGMQGLFERVAGQNIIGLVGPAGSFDPLQALGFPFAIPGLSSGGGNTSQASLAEPIPNNRVADGECRKYVNFPSKNGSKEHGGCDAGKGATCVVEYSGNTFTCNSQ